MTVEPQSAPREARETIQALASPLSLRWQAQSPALPDLRSTSHVVTKSVAETYAPSAHNSVASAVRRADKRAMSKYLRLVRPRAARTETEGTNSHKSSSPHGRALREQKRGRCRSCRKHVLLKSTVSPHFFRCNAPCTDRSTQTRHSHSCHLPAQISHILPEVARYQLHIEHGVVAVPTVAPPVRLVPHHKRPTCSTAALSIMAS